MPPRAAPVDDSPTALTLILKHGTATVFLFASPSWTFSELSSKLFACIRDRFPDGLPTSKIPFKTTAVPTAEEEDAWRIVYGVQKDKENVRKGFRELRAEDTDTLRSKGLQDLTTMAFSLVRQDELGAGHFEVVFPDQD
ncbi:hypothetical protein QBC35DRAFT_217940 [Podospora australis]|uniref:Uncharacterized protein n=1 Tax=Podospora australis TaxID=1536484 RepID=A0AAN6WXG8_9PEZI|nr:hypothetical protein QBC35DRAFT_217940 [Podospora australis]